MRTVTYFAMGLLAACVGFLESGCSDCDCPADLTLSDGVYTVNGVDSGDETGNASSVPRELTGLTAEVASDQITLAFTQDGDRVTVVFDVVAP